MRLRVGRRWVDASSFDHPGGDVIRYFADQDASVAFSSFHGHSRAAWRVLVELPDAESSPETADEDGAAHAWCRLNDEWRRRGLYAPSRWKNALHALATCAALVVAVRRSADWPLAGGALLGVAWAHCGFLQHMAGHRAWGAWSAPAQHFFEGLCKGGSATWWRARHNKHHAKTNVPARDGDLRTTPFFAWDESSARSLHDGVLRHQASLFLPVLAAYVFVFALTVRRYVVRRRLLLDAALIAAHGVLVTISLAAVGHSLASASLAYAVGYAVQGVYLGFFFSLSHFAYERNDGSIGWVEATLRGTVNWNADSVAWSYVSGFLNLQIEHHMAPQMPMENLIHIREDCRALARSHGLPYREFTLAEATRNVFGTMRRVGLDERARRDGTLEDKLL